MSCERGIKICFNPRTRNGCEQQKPLPMLTTKCFNPRTRNGCEPSPSHRCQRARVSIHAPVMGAKQIDQTIFNGYDVSIHAPVMGAKRIFEQVQGYARVSIHAPVMGAKYSASVLPTPMMVSIHAPVMGANATLVSVKTGRFGFNPRTRNGCEIRACRLCPILVAVSIHAPVMGAKPSPINSNSSGGFQSTHP